MAAILDLSDLVNRVTGGNDGTPEAVFFHKDARIGAAAAAATVAGRMTSLWRYNGIPAGGAVPGAAANPDNTTVGALLQTDPGGGRQKWLLGVVGVPLNAGTLILYDRLRHIGGFSGTVTTPQAFGGAASRYTGVEAAGNQIWVEIYTQIGATGTTITASYTNESGTAGRTTVATAIGATGFREEERIIRLPLQSGDRGVRSVESVTLAATTGTAGEFGVTLAKPLTIMPFASAGVGQVRDLIAGLPGILEIKPGACLAWAWLANVATAPVLDGSVHMVEA